MNLQFKTPIEVLLAATGIFVAGTAIGASLTWVASHQLGTSAKAQAPRESLRPKESLASTAAPGRAQALDDEMPPELELLSARAGGPASTSLESSGAAVATAAASGPALSTAAVQTVATRSQAPAGSATAQEPRSSVALPARPTEAAKPAAASRPVSADTGATSPTPAPTPAETSPPSAPAAAQAPATKNPAEQHIALAQAGIASLGGAEVRFASGRVVTIGEVFPSGEKLLSVDPGRQRIVTDKRTIVLH